MSIKILNSKYKVNYVDSIDELTIEGTCGDVDYINKIINIGIGDNHNPKYPEKFIEETFYHELAHAFLYETCNDDINSERLAEIMSAFAIFVKKLNK